MKILFVTKFYPPTEGGIERYSQVLCTGLCKRGIEVEVIASAAEGRTSRIEEIDGIKVHRLGALMQIKGLPLTPALPRLLARLAPACDLLHFNFPNPWAEMSYLAMCRAKRSVVTYHSDIYRQKIFLRLYRPWIHRFLSRTLAIIATSPNYLESSPFLSRYRARCRSIALPVDTQIFSRASPEAIEAIKGEFGSFVLFVGRLVYYKGLEHLIDAMTLLRDIRLVVIGRGELESVCQAQAERLGLGERVRFLGKVDDDKLGLFYAACECFVLPSIVRSEAFGIVLGEAMACATPVISTELGTGTSYVNQDGQTGFVVPPSDPAALAEKIALICGDDRLRAELGARARERIEQGFTSEQMIEKTIALYKEVLAEPGGLLRA